MYRYLAAFYDPTDPNCTTLIRSMRAAVRARRREWSIAYEASGAIVLHAYNRHSGQTTSTLLDQDAGIILGQLFSKSCHDHTEAMDRLDGTKTKAIVSSNGEELIRGYWGSYLAIIADKRHHTFHVIREPTGNFPCNQTAYRGLRLLFAEAGDCASFIPITFNANRAYLTRWLIFTGISGRETGIQGVEEVLGGERLTISGVDLTRKTLWDPIAIAAESTTQSLSVEGAAAEVRSVVQAGVNAWASRYQKLMLRLSGGLDSSIVAACLANAPTSPAIECLNFVAETGFEREQLYLPGIDERLAHRLRATSTHGDERHFARLVAERWHMPLLEVQRNLSIDLSRLWTAPLRSSPALLFTSLDVEDAEIELAQTRGVEAFFSGQAGDSVFLATTEPFAAVDYMFVHGFRSELWGHVFAACTLSGESFWEVVWRSLKSGLLRLPYRSPVHILDIPTLLPPETVKAMRNADFATSYSANASHILPPGKRNHVEGLAGGSVFNFAFHSSRYGTHVDPLNSQPVWEALLKIPTYLVLTGGVSRGLVRQAFKELLPPEICKRQIKGTGTAFYQQLVRHNREFLRDQLMNGRLVSDGYLDARALGVYLDADEPFVTVSASQILSYLSAEIWLQQLDGARPDSVADRCVEARLSSSAAH